MKEAVVKKVQREGKEMMKSSTSDWRDGFLFLGNHLFLDFLNTRPEQDGNPQELLTDWRALVRWFRAAELINSQEAATLERTWAESNGANNTLEAVREFRERLRKDLIAWEGGAPVRPTSLQELNDLMSQHPMLTKIGSDKGKLTTVQWFRWRKPGDLFAPLAYAAANLFSNVNPGRVRKCEHCVLHFHDTSKIGTRRWCSMRLCGNRSKVAAYAARHSSSRS